MNKRYGLKGINDERHECSVCGKVELKRVMWIVELDDDGNEIGLPFHCGTTCGAKLLNQKIPVVKRAIKSLTTYKYEKMMEIAETTPEMKKAMELRKELDKLPFSERRSDPRASQVLFLITAAKAYAAERIPPMPIE